MKSEARNRTLVGLRVSIDLPPSEILAILQLLGSAQMSVANHGDSFCAGLLDQCAAHLRERYGISGGERSIDPVWAESSLPALVHLLIYVQAEVEVKLSDPGCAAALDQCIDRLLQTCEPQHDEFGRVVTAH
jgi:hypothetical protein